MMKRKVFSGRLLKVFVRPVKYAKCDVKLEYIEHPGAVLIIPVLNNGDIIMIKQFRPVVNSYIWELPAGTLEKNESPVNCAKRELIEEVGYKTNKIKKLGSIYPCPGYSNEKILIYKATALVKTNRNVMEDEIIEEHVLKISEIKKLISNGKIVDSKTLAALLMLFRNM